MIPAQVVFYIYGSLLVIGFMAGFVRFKRHTLPYKIITFNFLAAFLTELAALLVVQFDVMTNNLVIFIPYCAASHIFYVSYFTTTFPRDRMLRIMAISISVFICLFAPVNYMLFQNDGRMATNILMTGSVCVLACTFRSFFLLLEQIDETSIFRKSIFWMNCGILLYFAASIVHWSFFNLFTFHMKNSEATELMRNIYTIISLLFYGITVFVMIKESLPRKKARITA